MGNFGSGHPGDILRDYLLEESGGEAGFNPNEFNIDWFVNEFEDEFPKADNRAVEAEPYIEESGRANSQQPYGRKFADRPKIYELNQGIRAQQVGLKMIDFHPNREYKQEFYRLGGTPAELRIMLQILRATREMIGRNIIFEEWFKMWQDGFPEFKENRNITNFPLSGNTPWRAKTENKPRYYEWTKPAQRLAFGFRVIEYWRDRSVNESVVLSGTDLDLIRHILQLEYEGGGSESIKNKGGNLPYLKGQPLIKLHFVQSNNIPAGKQPTRGEISFRIMDKTDDPASTLDKISKADLTQYATRIKEKFGTQPLFKWEKGKEVISYHHRQQGFEGWYVVKNKQSGIDIITRLLYVIGKTIDLSKVSHSVNADPLTAYPDAPTPITILGEQIKPPAERPIVEVEFVSAEIVLPKSRKKPIQLVYKSEIVYK